MAYCFSGVSFQPKYNPSFDWIGIKDKSFNPHFNDCVAASSENYPFLFTGPLSAKLKSSQSKLFDVFYVRAMHAVSERFRLLIENYEPNTHQFFEVNLYKKDNTRFEGKYFLMNILNKVEAIIYEKSDVSEVIQNDRKFYVTGTNGKQRFLRKEKIKNIHLWKDEFSRLEVYMSDFLFQEYTDLGMYGYSLNYKCIEE